MDKLCKIEDNVPAHWVSYLINGDSSGLDESEVQNVKEYCQGANVPLHAVSSEEYGIGRFRGIQCDLETVTWLVPYVPFLIRRKYFSDSKSWELFAVFPTLAADSSSWYNMQAEAENGDSFSCSHDYLRTSSNVRGIDPARVAAFEARVRGDWEKDTDSPFSLIRYERIHSSFGDIRAASWRNGRAS